jgi:hypothetical protein
MPRGSKSTSQFIVRDMIRYQIHQGSAHAHAEKIASLFSHLSLFEWGDLSYLESGWESHDLS